MGVTFTRTFDELELQNLIDLGFTTVKLYVSNGPEGPYTDTSATVNPSTLAALEATNNPPYNMTFVYAAGNYSQWFKFIPEGPGVSWDSSLSAPFHGGGGINLLTIRQRIGKTSKNMITGTTTSAGNVGGTTAICTSAKIKRFANDYFGGTPNTQGWFFLNLSTQVWDEISDWDASTGTFTFKTGLGAQVGSGVNFELWRMWTPDEVRDAINWAIVDSYPALNKPIIDYGFITEENKFQMYVPNDMLTIYKVEKETDNFPESMDFATRGHPWEPIPFIEIFDSLTRILEFKRSMDGDQRIRVTGSGILSRMFSDTDFTEVREPQVELIVFKAISYLFFLMANEATSTDVDRWRDQYQFYKNQYDTRVKEVPVRRPAKSMFAQETIWKGAI